MKIYCEFMQVNGSVGSAGSPAINRAATWKIEPKIVTFLVQRTEIRVNACVETRAKLSFFAAAAEKSAKAKSSDRRKANVNGSMHNRREQIAAVMRNCARRKLFGICKMQFGRRRAQITCRALIFLK